MTDNNQKKFCYKCGNELYEEATICPKCGVKQPSLIKENRSKVGAALFAFFLGPLGIHKFYLGEKGWGIAYILIDLTVIGFFIIAIVSFIEGILYLSMSNEAFNLKYNN